MSKVSLLTIARPLQPVILVTKIRVPGCQLLVWITLALPVVALIVIKRVALVWLNQPTIFQQQRRAKPAINLPPALVVQQWIILALQQVAVLAILKVDQA